jgi:crotonobetainyl-CoA:carnitine CoA-transferase CaiB-like acyl-CoA transferase
MNQINARDRTIPVVTEAVGSRSFDDLITAFEDAGIPFSPIHRPAEMYDDPHVTRPGGLFTSSLPDGTTYRAPAMPFEIDDQTLVGDNLDIVASGADTHSVLSRIGLTETEIAVASGMETAA